MVDSSCRAFPLACMGATTTDIAAPMLAATPSNTYGRQSSPDATDLVGSPLLHAVRLAVLLNLHPMGTSYLGTPAENCCPVAGLFAVMVDKRRPAAPRT